MERATKERLTGAVIFFAALVILVPEMLSGPEDHVLSDEAGAVADTGPPLTTYDLAIDPAAAPASSRQQELSGVASEAEAIAQAVPPPVRAPAQPDSVDVEGSAAGPTDAITSPLPASSPTAGTRVETSEPVKAPVTAVAAATKPKAGNTATGTWWVQLGSFASAQNAQAMARDLRAKGYAIDVAVVHSAGKDLHAVRAGPEKDRAAATALRARLAAAGNPGILVAP